MSTKSRTMHRINDEMGVYINLQRHTIDLYDTRAYTPKPITVIDTEQFLDIWRLFWTEIAGGVPELDPQEDARWCPTCRRFVWPKIVHRDNGDADPMNSTETSYLCPDCGDDTLGMEELSVQEKDAAHVGVA
mgnify:CR=1 FL=1